MKKVLTSFCLVLTIMLFVGCSCSLLTKTPTDKVKEFMNKYNNNDEDVITELDDYVDTLSFTDENKETYREILKTQYKDLKYEVIDETIDGDNATVDVKITVYDYFKVQNEALSYYDKNKNEFKDEEEFIKYRLNQMQNSKETIEYTVTFNLYKDENEWIVEQLSDTDLEKIHGIYNYEND